MFENFDLSWFLTTPGMLTCLGCLLIIISIIIFISSLRGNKKDKVQNTDAVTQPIPDVENVGQEVNTVQENGMTSSTDAPSVEPVQLSPVNVLGTEQENNLTTNVVTPVEVASVNAVETSTNNNQEINVSSTEISSQQESINVQPVQVEPVATKPLEINVNPQVETMPQQEPISVQPVQVEPVATTPLEINVNSQVETTPQQEPISVQPVQVEPVATTPLEINVNPQVETTPQQEPISVQPVETSTVTLQPQTTPNYVGINIEPVIQPVQPNNPMTESQPVNLPYGGTNPAATVTPLQEESKVIYGGADPLAGTGIIPKVSNEQVTGLKKTDDIESL